MVGADKINKLIADAREDVLKLMKTVEDEQLQIILALLNDLTTRSGLLRPDESDFKVLKRITDAIAAATASDNFTKAIDLFAPTVDGITLEVKSMVLAVNPDFKFKKGIVDVTQDRKVVIEALTKNLRNPASFRVNIQAPLRTIVNNAVQNNMPYDEAVRIIEKYVKGDAEKGGKLARYVDQVAEDALNQWQGTVNARIGSAYGMIDFIYSGPTKTTSRPQCRRWLHKNWVDAGNTKRKGYKGILPREIIEAEMLRAEKTVGKGKKSIFFSGYSQYAFPTVDNFPIIRGGHRCDDVATPTLLTVKEANKAIDRYNSIEGTKITQRYEKERA